MTTSGFGYRRLKRRVFLQISRLPVATFVLLATVTSIVSIAIAWFAGEGTISAFFAHVHLWQEHPPTWLEVPDVTHPYLLIPAIVLVLASWSTIKISPRPKIWSQIIIISIVLALTIRYVLWRFLSTLNLADPLNGLFSLGLFSSEMLMIFASSVQLYLMLRIQDRRREADQLKKAVIQGSFLPSVDILIPTYNEPSFILQRTIIGCLALNYPNKKVYLLDDQRRPEIQKLAQELGCEYIARPDNRYAKAGNLNYAITKTNGQLIAVFDADFIPLKNFLTRTVGFFQNPKIALVQTPQSFYNHDPISRNLGLENVITSEEEVFYRQVELIKDGAESVVCAGTAFVVRRSALENTGGFVTDSISEDYFTGICLSAKGYRLIYLDEKLSAGLAAENISAHITQRMRWARGTLQAFFIDANPLTIPGLNLVQRFAHLVGLLYWFTSLTPIVFLLMPLAYSFLGVVPLRATPAEVTYFFLPYYLVQLTVFSWLNRYSRSAILSDIYAYFQCFPLALTVIQAMLRPFNKGFKVTPKGISSHSFVFNWNLAIPLIFLWIVTAFSVALNIHHCLTANATLSAATDLLKGMSLGLFWSFYNLVMLSVSLLILVDVPKPDIYEWFELQRVVRLKIGSEIVWGMTTLISEAGAEVKLTQPLPQTLTNQADQIVKFAPDQITVTLEIMEENLRLEGQLFECHLPIQKNQPLDSKSLGGFPTVQIFFDTLSLNQQKALIELLYCRPGQWQRYNSPGEFQSLLLLFKVLLKPRILFDRNRRVKAVVVSQV